MLQVLCALQDNGQVRQTVHYAFNVGNAKPCVDQDGSFTPAQQIAVRFLPMLIFADRKCVRVDPLYCEPVIHPQTFPYQCQLPFSTLK